MLGFNSDWAHTNIGVYAYDVHGFELSFVVDRQGRTVYGQIEGERTAASAFDVLSENLATLIAALHRMLGQTTAEEWSGSVRWLNEWRG